MIPSDTSPRSTLALITLSLLSLQTAPEAGAQATIQFQASDAFVLASSEDASAVLLSAPGAFQLWTAGSGTVDLVTPGVDDPLAFGLSADGLTAVGRGRFSSVLRPAFWTAVGGWTSLGSELVRPTGTVPCFGGMAVDASRDGSVIVGGTRVDSSAPMLPFIWSAATGMVELPAAIGQAFYISDDGEVVWGRVGARWGRFSASGELTGSLSAPPGGFGDAEIFEISPNGDHAVGSGALLGGLIWNPTVGFQSPNDFNACCPVTDPIGSLGFPLGGQFNAVNNGASVAIGHWSWEPVFFDRQLFPIVWTPGGGSRRIQDELQNRGADLMGRTIDSAVALSSDGRRFVGQYSDPGTGELGWYSAEWDLAVGNTFCSSVDLNSTGVVGSLTAEGSDVLMDEQLTLLATDLPQFFNGFLISSSQFVPFSNNPPPGNNLCLRGGIGRHVDSIRNSGREGAFAIPVNLTSLPTPMGAPVAAMVGETWAFQVWHRDAGGGAGGSSFTEGVSVLLK